jgi:hypothetical protein
MPEVPTPRAAARQAADRVEMPVPAAVAGSVVAVSVAAVSAGVGREAGA